MISEEEIRLINEVLDDSRKCSSFRVLIFKYCDVIKTNTSDSLATAEVVKRLDFVVKNTEFVKALFNRERTF